MHTNITYGQAIDIIVALGILFVVVRVARNIVDTRRRAQ